MFITGLDGQARRMFTYSEETGFGPLNLLASIGSLGLILGFLVLVYNIYWSTRYMPRNIGSDPWDARSLEWATHSPVPVYNFATIPHVNSSEAFWDSKKKGHNLFPDKVEEIHMPNNSGVPLIMCILFFIGGFAMVFSMFTLAIISLIGIFACMAYRSFEANHDHGYHIHVKEIEETEKRLRGTKS
jgi:cytochrome aa3-600 menaquinol oxidase subunit 1